MCGDSVTASLFLIQEGGHSRVSMAHEIRTGGKRHSAFLQLGGKSGSEVVVGPFAFDPQFLLCDSVYPGVG